MQAQRIEAIKKRFPNEWLLIAVDEVDESTTTPISGKLLAHSAQRHAIYRRLLSLKRRFPVLVEYSKDTMPKGFVAAF
jgi:hypothetical protein